MTLDAKTVEQALSTKFGSDYSSNYFWSELDWNLDPERSYGDPVDPYVTIDGETYEVEVLDADTGHEGHGESIYCVVKVGDEVFRKTGYYASHHGDEWDGQFKKVRGVEKTITVWENA